MRLLRSGCVLVCLQQQVGFGTEIVPLPAAGQRHVLWHNMREEPVLYINGKPYVVREADQPFCNVEYTGAWGLRPVVGAAQQAQQSCWCRTELTAQNHEQLLQLSWSVVAQEDVLTRPHAAQLPVPPLENTF